MYTVENVSGNTGFAEEIYALEKECFNDLWSKELIFSELAANKGLYLVCVTDSQIVGYINASMITDEAELNRIAVSKSYRQRGIAKILMNYFISYLKNKSFKRIILEVRSNNNSAIGLYESFGFSKDCIRKKYYQNPEDDAILMSLTI